jgi:type 1 fimbria pilin
MKILPFSIILPLLVFSVSSQANCVLKRGSPATITLPSTTIRIAADTPSSVEKPFYRVDSNSIGRAIGYDECIAGTEYGRALTYLAGKEITNQIYPTDIPGIGVKVLWTASNVNFVEFPKTQAIRFPSGEAKGTFDFPPQSAYRLEFYKLQDQLRLNQTTNQLLPAGLIAYNYLFSPTPSNYIMQLNLGTFTLESEPSCTLDSSKIIRFDQVTRSDLLQGIPRDLAFKINCRSDYQTFNARASITTKTPNSDNKSIKVTDAAGNNDTLLIRIVDSQQRSLAVNGLDYEERAAVTQGGDAEFAWQAILNNGSKGPPAAGPFSAYAEIQFTIE